MNKLVAGVGVLLVGLIAFEWLVPVKAPVGSGIGDAAGAPEDTNLLARADRSQTFPAIAAYQTVKDRPLFFEGRRPPPEFVPTPEPQKEKPVEVKKIPPPIGNLTGIVAIGDKTYALVSGSGKKAGTRRLLQGDDMDGWRVEKVAMDKVVLMNGAERHEMPLRTFKQVPLPTAKPEQVEQKGGAEQKPDQQAGTPRPGRRPPRNLRPPVPDPEGQGQQGEEVRDAEQQETEPEPEPVSEEELNAIP